MDFDSQTLRLLDSFALRTRRSFYGARQGAHRSLRRGHGVEFAEYRSYEIGDNPRYIDWNLYARSDKIYVKRYLEEETVSFFIVIDGSRSLTHPALQLKWNAAAHLAACASYVALAHQDPVTISILGGAHSPSFWGTRAFPSIQKFLDGVTASGDSSLPSKLNITEAARRAATRVSFPGICLFISDFLYPLDEVASIINSFRARNMEMHAVQVLGPMDIDPSPGATGGTLIDSETGEPLGLSLDPQARTRYAQALSTHIDRIRTHCYGAQVDFVSMVAKEPLSHASLETLTSMGLFV